MTKRHKVATVAIVFCVFLLSSCALLDRSIIAISEEMGFNTKRDPLGYTLDDKTSYRKHKFFLKTQKREREKELLRRLQESNGNPQTKSDVHSPR
ncbi:MAG TPA: hypothetical protein VJC18_07485 [bacterium]|nr:hypothetical protein [bacterium]